jgi:signal peptidase II
MKKLNLRNHWPLFLCLVIWLGIDLTTKVWASSANFGTKIFIKNFFYLTLHYNQGVAFGFFFGQWPQILLSLAILGALTVYATHEEGAKKTNGFLQQALLGIIMGGAIGNLANRIWLGYVIDFIYLKPFPVFNFADLGITLGLLTLFLITLKKSNP